MSCTTHFHACDCREEMFKNLKEENERLKNGFDAMTDRARINGEIALAEQEKVRVLKEAVEFYSHLSFVTDKNWDAGNCARAALKTVEEISK